LRRIAKKISLRKEMENSFHFVAALPIIGINRFSYERLAAQPETHRAASAAGNGGNGGTMGS
jgi:hypothetical protein